MTLPYVIHTSIGCQETGGCQGNRKEKHFLGVVSTSQIFNASCLKFSHLFRQEENIPVFVILVEARRTILLEKLTWKLTLGSKISGKPKTRGEQVSPIKVFRVERFQKYLVLILVKAEKIIFIRLVLIKR